MNTHLRVATKTWPLREPFVISRATQTICEVIVVSIDDGKYVGRGEAVGVDYHGETLQSLCAQVESVRDAVEAGVSRRELMNLLPAGGARNAIDCALWDLEAKRSGLRAWELAGMRSAHPIETNFTIGIRSLADYERRAAELALYPWLKIKVNADDPVAVVRAIRRGAPLARLVVDANQAWSIRQLVEVAPLLADLKVDLLEQPVAEADDAGLADLDLPVPICADEPVNTVADLPRIVDRYDFINIKLDKTGGLTAALELAAAARKEGLRLMVGCMVGGSVAMAPGMIVGQLCEIVDLDGPLLQSEDWPNAITYEQGLMHLPSRELWG